MNPRLAAVRRDPGLSLVASLALLLLVVNLFLSPAMFGRHQLDNTVTLIAPTMLAAMASVPSIMTGRGGLDLSIGPLLGFVNVVLVGVLLAHGLGSLGVAAPLCLLIGAGIGALSGALIAYGRLQPVVVTLGGYLVLSGVSLVVMGQPVGKAPSWTSWLAGAWLGGWLPKAVLLPIVAALVWGALRYFGAVGLFLATGSDDRAAYTSGVRVGRVLVLAYAVGGLFAAMAGIALTTLIASGDPLSGKQYTLAAIAAVALGGNPLFGGRGTLIGPVLGSVSLFLIQTLLSSLNVSSLWIQVVYGLVLLTAVTTNASLLQRLSRRGPEGVPA